MVMEKFHYTHGKKKITLMRFGDVFTNIGEIRVLRSKSVVEQLFVAVEKAADAKTLEVIDSMSVDEFNKFAEAWQSDAGVNMGESGASATS